MPARHQRYHLVAVQCAVSWRVKLCVYRGDIMAAAASISAETIAKKEASEIIIFR